MNKSILREKYKKIRSKISEKEEKSKCIAVCFCDSDLFKNSDVIALYSPVNGEADVRGIFEICKSMGKTVCFPKVVSKEEMQFLCVDSLNELSCGMFNILEPSGEKICKKEDIDIILVPGICFDTNMYRVGYGGGFYDRFLKNSDILKIGICFSEQIFKKGAINAESTDIPMDMLLCEKGFISAELAN